MEIIFLIYCCNSFWKVDFFAKEGVKELYPLLLAKMHTLVSSLSAERHLPRYLPAGPSCVPPVCGLKLHPSHSRVNL